MSVQAIPPWKQALLDRKKDEPKDTWSHLPQWKKDLLQRKHQQKNSLIFTSNKYEAGPVSPPLISPQSPPPTLADEEEGDDTEEVTYGKGFVHKLLKKFSHMGNRDENEPVSPRGVTSPVNKESEASARFGELGEPRAVNGDEGGEDGSLHETVDSEIALISESSDERLGGPEVARQASVEEEHVTSVAVAKSLFEHMIAAAVPSASSSEHVRKTSVERAHKPSVHSLIAVDVLSRDNDRIKTERGQPDRRWSAEESLDKKYDKTLDVLSLDTFKTEARKHKRPIDINFRDGRKVANKPDKKHSPVENSKKISSPDELNDRLLSSPTEIRSQSSLYPRTDNTAQNSTRIKRPAPPIPSNHSTVGSSQENAGKMSPQQESIPPTPEHDTRPTSPLQDASSSQQAVLATKPGSNRELSSPTSPTTGLTKVVIPRPEITSPKPSWKKQNVNNDSSWIKLATEEPEVLTEQNGEEEGRSSPGVLLHVDVVNGETQDSQTVELNHRASGQMLSHVGPGKLPQAQDNADRATGQVQNHVGPGKLPRAQDNADRASGQMLNHVDLEKLPRAQDNVDVVSGQGTSKQDKASDSYTTPRLVKFPDVSTIEQAPAFNTTVVKLYNKPHSTPASSRQPNSTRAPPAATKASPSPVQLNKTKTSPSPVQHNSTKASQNSVQPKSTKPPSPAIKPSPSPGQPIISATATISSKKLPAEFDSARKPPRKMFRKSAAAGPGDLIIRPATNIAPGAKITPRYNDIRTGSFAPANKKPEYYSDSDEEQVDGVEECVVFINAEVKLNRSLLAKSRRGIKLTLTFTDSQPSIYEYPSEQFLMESLPPQPGDVDYESQSQGEDNDTNDTVAAEPLGLMSTYHSKLVPDYELGSTINSAPPPPQPTTPDSPDPLEEAEEFNWSQSASSDLLF